MDGLEDELVMGLMAMENTPAVVESMAAWRWIVSALLGCKKSVTHAQHPPGELPGNPSLASGEAPLR